MRTSVTIGIDHYNRLTSMRTRSMRRSVGAILPTVYMRPRAVRGADTVAGVLTGGPQTDGPSSTRRSREDLRRLRGWAVFWILMLFVVWSTVASIFGHGPGDPRIPAPTPTEVSMATAIAHTEASTTVPSGDGSPTPQAGVVVDATGWPSNVQSVSVIVSAHGAPEWYVGAPAGYENHEVLVIQLTGAFSAATTGRPGSAPYATGQVMTVLVDAIADDVFDVRLESRSDAHILTDATTLFSRHTSEPAEPH